MRAVGNLCIGAKDPRYDARRMAGSWSQAFEYGPDARAPKPSARHRHSRANARILDSTLMLALTLCCTRHSR